MATATRDNILDCAFALAKTDGRYDLLTRDGVAMRTPCSPGSVNYYFNRMDSLKAAVVERAIQAECLPIIARAAINDWPSLPLELRARALASV